MTKDVELHSSTWKTMKQAITGLTENATVSTLEQHLEIINNKVIPPVENIEDVNSIEVVKQITINLPE